jgi:hypothetical protein
MGQVLLKILDDGPGIDATVMFFHIRCQPPKVLCGLGMTGADERFSVKNR